MSGTVLITGATGFLGKVITGELYARNYKLVTIGRHAENTIRADISGVDLNINWPAPIDIVVHAAGKAHSVPRTKNEEQEFFDVNFEGTKNLCNGLIASGVKPAGFIFISTVAVYGLDRGELIGEDSPLKGRTPYAQSKIQAEGWLKTWAETNNIKLAILRLPLVAGPYPPGNLGAMIKGIRTGKYLRIGDAKAKKSVVWAADIANIIPAAAGIGGTYNLTDGCDPSFKELEDTIAGVLKIEKVKRVPYWFAKLLALVGDLLGARAPINTDKLSKITSTLTFDSSRAVKNLNWQPTPVLDKITDII
jgi:nucleoside-diphosphate-sugar epimerase